MAHLDIRCRKQEKLDLLLPDKFMKAYSLTALRLMDQARSMNQLRLASGIENTICIRTFMYFWIMGYGGRYVRIKLGVRNLMGFVADKEIENLSNILSGLRMTP